MSLAKFLIAAAMSLCASAAVAQTSPGFQIGQTLGAAQLNSAIGAKTDYSIATPQPLNGAENVQARQSGVAVQITTAAIAALPIPPAAITALPAASTLTGSELIPGVQSGGAVKMTAGAIQGLSYVPTNKQFGAVGDGVTDDAAADNAFLAYVAANGGQGTWAPGTYLHKSQVTLTLSASANIRISGAGGHPRDDRRYLGAEDHRVPGH